MGAGLGINGSFFSGENDEWSLTVTKAWDKAIPKTMWKPMVVFLMVNDQSIEHALLTKDNDYTAEFKNLPNPDSVQSFSVREDTINEDGTVEPVEPTGDWKVAYGKLKKNATAKTASITVTNGIPEVSIAVEKRWVGADGADVPNATCWLVADGKRSNMKAVLSAEGGWAATFEGLPKYKVVNDKFVAIDYSVEEEPLEGYTAEIAGNAKDGFIITNTYKPPTPATPAPRTGDGTTGMLAMLLLAAGACGALIARRKKA